MKLVFCADRVGNCISVEGHVDKYTIVNSTEGVSGMEIDFIMTSPWGVAREGDCTKVLPLPNLNPGVIRVWNPQFLRIEGETIHLKYPRFEFYESHESACAAIMEEVITESVEHED